MSGLTPTTYDLAFTTHSPRLSLQAFQSRSRLSKALTDDVNTYLLARLSAEEAYIKALSKASKNAFSSTNAELEAHEGSRLDKGFREMKERLQKEVEEVIEVHEKWAAQVEDRVLGTLGTQRVAQEWNDLRGRENQLVGIVKEYEDAASKVQKAQTKLSSTPPNSKSYPTAQSKLSSLQILLSTSHSTYTHSAPSLFTSLQTFDHHLLTSLHSSLSQLHSTSTSLARSRAEIAKRGQDGVRAVRVGDEMWEWAVENGQAERVLEGAAVMEPDEETVRRAMEGLPPTPAAVPTSQPTLESEQTPSQPAAGTTTAAATALTNDSRSPSASGTGSGWTDLGASGTAPAAAAAPNEADTTSRSLADTLGSNLPSTFTAAAVGGRRPSTDGRADGQRTQPSEEAPTATATGAGGASGFSDGSTQTSGLFAASKVNNSNNNASNAGPNANASGAGGPVKGAFSSFLSSRTRSASNANLSAADPAESDSLSPRRPRTESRPSMTLTPNARQDDNVSLAPSTSGLSGSGGGGGVSRRLSMMPGLGGLFGKKGKARLGDGEENAGSGAGSSFSGRGKSAGGREKGYSAGGGAADDSRMETLGDEEDVVTATTGAGSGAAAGAAAANGTSSRQVDEEGYTLPPSNHDRKPWEEPGSGVGGRATLMDDEDDAVPSLDPTSRMNLSIAPSALPLSSAPSEADLAAIERMKSTLRSSIVPPTATSSAAPAQPIFGPNATGSALGRRGTARGRRAASAQTAAGSGSGSVPPIPDDVPLGRVIEMRKQQSLGLGSAAGTAVSSANGDRTMSFASAKSASSASNPFGGSASGSMLGVGDFGQVSTSPQPLSPALATAAPAAAALETSTGTPKPVVSVTETVNVLTRGQTIERILITGEVALAPGSIPLSGSNSDLKLRIRTKDETERVVPNGQFLAAAGHETWTINGSELQRAAKHAPSTGAIVLKYQVRADLDTGHHLLPIELNPQWKCEPTQTSVIIAYNPVSGSRFNGNLSRLALVLPHSSAVTSVQSKPVGEWQADKSRLVWQTGTLQDIELQGGQGGKVLARFAVQEQAEPKPVAVTWVVDGALVSMVDVEVEVDGKVGGADQVIKRTISGKYLALPA